ncbi:NAD+ diphosphatase [Natranaerovirga hydrolytica]|uniref:NAD(+) diphosphatase n=1 Tax=Natranaerovirga hydrolytica TaxID=680378 RepID=A0A4R1MAM6_9FIRM|nr:NAD(+) diphosphatase [Natranaerovirga hydrolytica]TCK89085.1 NAD+ diphosphatase [Natranaerovirga hydrolytica]
MIQDIFPHQFDNSYRNIEPDEKSYLVFVHEQTVLLKNREQEITLPQFERVHNCGLETNYLFSISGHRFFLVDGRSREDDSSVLRTLLEDGYQFHNVSILREHSPKWMYFAIVTAYQLGNWYHNNRYCGKCGGFLEKSPYERILFCKDCNHIIYPKIQPVVIVGVTHHDRILLTKYVGAQHSKRYALIAGFAEIGETIEETVQREVMEEVGVRVKNIRYYKSQPWALSDTLLFGFFCELDGSEEITMDKNELSVAEWVRRDDILSEQDDISLTSEMIDRFKKERK